jgi:DDE family transposase
VKATGSRPRIVVSGDGRGVAGHVGSRLLADVADATGLTARFGEALASLRRRRRGYDPGRVAVDLAVMLADGGEAIADLAVLRNQPELFGQTASDATAWRLLSCLDSQLLEWLRQARAQARAMAWEQMDRRGGLPASTAAGRRVDGLVLDVDATIVVCHSEKESATPTWKRTFGFHPLVCFLDNTREALAGLLREGRAGSNTTADHIAVLEQALAQIPEPCRYSQDVLIRSDSAGCTHGFLRYIRSLREHGVRTFFSVGVAITEPVREAIRQVTGWVPALDGDGEFRDGAEVCELTGLIPAEEYPDGTRFIVRRERPHPGAQLSLFDTVEGMRHQVFATDTPVGRGSIQFLEARHRGHARVEDRIRCGKDTGFGRFPSRVFAINQAWLTLALVAIDLLAWTQILLLDGELGKVEPKTLRYRILHVAARITHSARRVHVRIAENWPWATELVNAFAGVTQLRTAT